MQRQRVGNIIPFMIRALLIVVLGLATQVQTQAPVPGEGPGWTGATEPKEVIEARRVLMQAVERLIKPIDSFTLGTAAEPAVLRSYAATIEPMLLVLPHLFPPTTNLYDPASVESPTIALPAIWQDFATFQKLAGSAEVAAATLAATEGEEPLRAASRNLRASCDACHALFTKPYEPPKATEADRDFDFERFLPK